MNARTTFAIAAIANQGDFALAACFFGEVNAAINSRFGVGLANFALSVLLAPMVEHQIRVSFMPGSVSVNHSNVA